MLFSYKVAVFIIIVNDYRTLIAPQYVKSNVNIKWNVLVLFVSLRNYIITH